MDKESILDLHQQRVIALLDERKRMTTTQIADALREQNGFVLSIIISLLQEGRVIRMSDTCWTLSLSERNRRRHRRKRGCGVGALSIFPVPTRWEAEATKHIGFFGPTKRDI